MKFVQSFQSYFSPYDQHLAIQSYLDLDDEILDLFPKNRITFSTGTLVGEHYDPPNEIDLFIEGFEAEIDRGLGLINTANAGLISSLGLGAAVIGILAGVMGTSFPFIDTFMATPLNRAIAYGVDGAAAGAGAAVTNGVGSSAEDNIEKLNELLKGFNNNGIGTGGGGSGNNPGAPTEKTLKNNNKFLKVTGNDPNAVPLTNDPTRPVSCVDRPAQGSGQTTAQGCPDIEGQIRTANGLSGLGSTFASFAGQSRPDCKRDSR